MKNRVVAVEKNINRSYVYQCLRSMDMTGAIWILYLGFHGMSLTQIGLLEGIFHLTSMLFEVPTGAIADLIGRKKTIVLGRLSAFISSIIMLQATEFWGFAIGFVFTAVSYNLGSGSEEALVYDSLKEVGKTENYIKINGRNNFIIEVMQGVGAFVGAILAQKSFTLSYIAAALFSLLALGVALRFEEPINDNLKKEVKVSYHFKESYQVIKANKQLVFLLVFYPIVFTFSAILYFYGQQYFGNLGFSKLGIAMIFLGNSIVGGLGAIISGKVESILKEKTGILLALGIGIGMIIFSMGTPGFAIIIFCSIGFLTAILQPINSEAINVLIPSEQRATLISVQSVGYSVMMIIFFPLAGMIGDGIGLELTFIILGIVLIVNTLLARVFQR